MAGRAARRERPPRPRSVSRALRLRDRSHRAQPRPAKREHARVPLCHVPYWMGGRAEAEGVGVILIISGSRGYHRDEYLPRLDEAIRLSGFVPKKLIDGANMDSVDRLSKIWAQKNGIPREGIEAMWDDHVKLGVPRGAMGPIRNGQLLTRGDALVALWDGESPGTADMIKKVRKANKPGFVYRLDGAPHERFAPKSQLNLFPTPGTRR